MARAIIRNGSALRLCFTLLARVKRPFIYEANEEFFDKNILFIFNCPQLTLKLRSVHTLPSCAAYCA